MCAQHSGMSGNFSELNVSKHAALRRARLRALCAGLAVIGSATAVAGDPAEFRNSAQESCGLDSIDAHVREQLAAYGPQSVDREYFGFIYSFEGTVSSAVTAGRSCAQRTACFIDTSAAAALLPRGAKPLGEWHTHPHQGKAAMLSHEDVRGAWHNRGIRCYAAYYGQPDGDIYAWDPRQTSVPTAMGTTVLIGNYFRDAAPAPAWPAKDVARDAAIIAAHQDPGSTCLSTNTNAQTADTGTRYCKRSVTSR